MTGATESVLISADNTGFVAGSSSMNWHEPLALASNIFSAISITFILLLSNAICPNSSTTTNLYFISNFKLPTISENSFFCCERNFAPSPLYRMQILRRSVALKTSCQNRLSDPKDNVNTKTTFPYNIFLLELTVYTHLLKNTKLGYFGKKIDLIIIKIDGIKSPIKPILS